MHPHLNVAIQAARRAGNLITRYMEQVDKISQLDRAVEEDIITTLQKAYPSHNLCSSRSGAIAGTDPDCEWMIEPLDSMQNYLHEFPHFAISIAMKYRDNIEHAVIYDPIMQELYASSKCYGARLNDRRIRVGHVSELKNALLCVPQAGPAQNVGAQFRHFGSAVLQLAYVASGRLDGYYETGLHPCQIAAGSLLIKEAGGYITDSIHPDVNDPLKTGNMLACSRKIYTTLISVIQ
jgi:myo-inositol-1(or 4)-monophosphatase